MKIIAKGINIRISNKKLKNISNFISNKKVSYVLNYLTFVSNKSSFILKKIINSAISNAEHNFGLDIDNLKILSIYINKGRSLKRVSFRAKGKLDNIIKRSSNITVILSNNY
ncbi:50S ribosomal protein L22 [endosymbiont of Pachyrhynchus infernalis]|uniref:50S ribosomal protein L22 n=1 Tax=endosymbiont of Pachyrhynchus infernalis TaxID=1971488 RepID=UPI000DC6DAEC|nr:50S ribosomal protein L22 [endosymbiont of Pachyrhynchus infernalis]BBA84837.1 50S ribosomal protein L22 [endosymbiont of Pachyrhynchus infernalis]